MSTENPLNTLTFDQLQQNLASFSSWEQKFKYIIELGKKLPPFPEDQKTPQTKVRGCVSNVWLIEVPTDNTSTFQFLAISDASIVSGLIAILSILLNGKSPLEILRTDIHATFKGLELDQHLSPNRANGFFAMVKKIQQLALLSLQKSTQ